MKAYRIKDWDKHYEVSQSRKIKHMTWVAMPNSLTGNGFRVIRLHKRATDLLAAWVLLLRLASMMGQRGLFVSDGGRALVAADIADETKYPEELFEFALPELCRKDIGWLEYTDDW